MMYDKQLCTIYEAENGYVVECREPVKKSDKKATDSACCMPDSETKTYTANSPAAVMKIVKQRLGTSSDAEYAADFKQAAASMSGKTK